MKKLLIMVLCIALGMTAAACTAANAADFSATTEPDTEPPEDTAHETAVLNETDIEDAVSFNGTVEEITPDPEKKGQGSILMTELCNPDYTVLFVYSPETKFYISLDDIRVGDKLNILHSPAMTRSIPPQTHALEIRPCNESK